MDKNKDFSDTRETIERASEASGAKEMLNELAKKMRGAAGKQGPQIDYYKASDVTKETLEKMRLTLQETKYNELAFILCKRNDGKITHGEPTCVGNYRTVDFSKSKCKAGKEIGSFHTHIDTLPASIEDLLNAYDQDIMCIGSKSLIPFYYTIECYSVIDKRTKEYAYKLYGEYKNIYDELSNKIKSKQITVLEANRIKEKEHSRIVNELLLLFHKFKL